MDSRICYQRERLHDTFAVDFIAELAAENRKTLSITLLIIHLNCPE